jgi:hypothetical protein
MRVEITNLQEFARVEFGGHKRFRTQLEILSDLRAKVEANPVLETTVVVPYKDEGDAVFDLDRYDSETGIAYYQYSTTAS